MTGLVDIGEDGVVLPHEHLVIDYRQKDGATAPVSIDVEDQCVAELRRATVSGVRAIVDCTPPGYGRDLEFLRRVSERSGMPIVASTGTFCEQWSPQPHWVQASSVEELAETFVAELSRSCGVIKVATSAAPTANDLRALRAAALAHVATGAPIVSHTSGAFGIEQVELFAELGVDLSKVLVSHVCAEEEPVEYAIAIASRGAYVGFDRLGHAAKSDAQWISLIRSLIAEGFVDRILLSHDSVQYFTGPGAIAGHTFSNPVHLSTAFTRLALESGISTEDLRRMTTHNPLTWLESNRVAP